MTETCTYSKNRRNGLTQKVISMEASIKSLKYDKKDIVVKSMHFSCLESIYAFKGKLQVVAYSSHKSY